MSKILITGGHLTPALSFIDYLQQQEPTIDIVFVGRKYAQVTNKQTSWEKQEITARGIPFIAFQAQKTGSFNPLTFWQTVRRAQHILVQQQVTHLLTFGGYLAVPFALAAKQLHLPIITHEQTRVLGRANRIISLLADQTAISFADTKTTWFVHPVLTGNPLREQIFDSQAPAPPWFQPKKRLPLLYIAGGSQGSQTINDNILPLLDQLTRDYTIIHQVGKASQAHNPSAHIATYLKQNLLHFDNYYYRPFLSACELAYFYPRLHLAVSRAGANTIAELTAFRIPTLYIPLPHANYNEQYHNAHALSSQHAALLLEQKNLLPKDLLLAINQLDSQQQLFRDNLHRIPVDKLANQRLLELFAFTPPASPSSPSITPARSRLVKH